MNQAIEQETTTVPVLLKKQDVARLLNVCLRTVDRKIADGTFGTVELSPRALRIYASDVNAYIKSCTRCAANEV